MYVAEHLSQHAVQGHSIHLQWGIILLSRMYWMNPRKCLRHKATYMQWRLPPHLGTTYSVHSSPISRLNHTKTLDLTSYYSDSCWCIISHSHIHIHLSCLVCLRCPINIIIDLHCAHDRRQVSKCLHDCNNNVVGRTCWINQQRVQLREMRLLGIRSHKYLLLLVISQIYRNNVSQPDYVN